MVPPQWLWLNKFVHFDSSERIYIAIISAGVKVPAQANFFFQEPARKKKVVVGSPRE